MKETFSIPLFNLVNCLSDAIDLINPNIIEHHKRVAYISHRLGEELELGKEEERNLFLSALLHDIGAVACNTTDNNQLLSFDIDNPHFHSLVGYFLLKKFQVFSSVADAVRGHHVKWDNGNGSQFRDQPVPFISHLIHLADRVDILVHKEENILDQVGTIRENIEKNAGNRFHPDSVNAFLNISKKESFWLDLTSPFIKEIVADFGVLPTIETSFNDLLVIAILISHIIDFRSPFTATHSSGVAVAAQQLALLFEQPAEEILLIKIAGYLHDIGKLSVSKDILEKPDALTPKEFNVIKKHAYHTGQVLNNLSFLKGVGYWASSHHEHLDGTGYPFHYNTDTLDTGARILAVADVFTALTEDRPYRRGLEKDDVISILKESADKLLLDKVVVNVLIEHFEAINSHRINVQQEATQTYRDFWNQINRTLA